MFRRYMHVEKLGRGEVDGILDGTCFVFPKLDGANTSVWLNEQGEVCCASRNQQIISDLQGFFDWVQDNEMFLQEFLECFPLGTNVYGEWLVPHTLKTYRGVAWNEFYVFDVWSKKHYVPFNVYQPLAHKACINVIHPLAEIVNPSEEQLLTILSTNTTLIEDGKGVGEGLVIKNYDYVNKYGRTTWAKMVTTDFREKHNREMGHPQLKGPDQIEEKIVSKFLTVDLIDKVVARIEANKSDTFSSKDIARLLETVFHDFVVEETHTFIKKFKNPTVDFKVLRKWVTHKIKEMKQELF